MLRFTLLILSVLHVAALSAQSMWNNASESSLPVNAERRIVPDQFRAVRLQTNEIQTVLHSAPLRNSAESAEASVVLTLPMPDGSEMSFRIVETPVMAPALQAKYPSIRCYTGFGLEDKGARLKADFTPWGFHGMIVTSSGETVFIDPYAHGNQEFYTVYRKSDFHKPDDEGFACHTEAEPAPVLKKNDKVIQPFAPQPEFVGDCQLRTYRLALACTGEYAQYHGGTVAGALAAMNTTMNRVNGIYETDLAVTMEIIPNNDEIIYLNGATDPYSNGSGGTMLGQNVSNLNSVIGTANYDIGHVFSTGGGGIAGLRVVCTNNKARGVTGGGNPVGDPFDVDYVAHEMGHQFGGNHTQNNNCNRVAAASMEPGSASTIMGYAGICNPNVQNNSDAYFHAISLQEMGAFITTGSGNLCPVKTSTGNNAPVVNAGQDYTIPASTPFMLTANAIDADGDSLTYNWEQMDPEFASMPPQAGNTGGPLFRSFFAVPEPTRYFPRLSDLVNNTNFTWEQLPGVTRGMSFRVTVRDNFAGAGCTDEDDVELSVDGNSGPFLVTAPNTSLTWLVGAPETVTWDVANTDAAPVNCSGVDILLSTDGGFTYPITLATNVPNNGTATVTVPNNTSDQCRVMVKGANNIFFDISNQNFSIELPPTPTFVITAEPGAADACAGDEVSYTLNAVSIAGFADMVDVAVSGAPAGATVDISPSVITPDAQVTITISGLTSNMAGMYNIEVTATSGMIVRTANASLNVFPGAPASAPDQVSPANGQSGIGAQATLNWDPLDFAETYTVQVANNPSFDAGSIVAEFTTSDTFGTVMTPGTFEVYYWRILGGNLCGDSDYSSTWAFQTGALDCDGHSYDSADVPVEISENDVSVVSSTLNVPDSGILGDVDVSFFASHTWVGDLSAWLVSPAGDTAELFNRPGVPGSQFGCNGDNAMLTFDDDAAQTATQLENACNGTPPALNGSYAPLVLLSTFNGQQVNGDWTLLIQDSFDEDGGALENWSLDFCFVVATPSTNMVNNNVLQVPAGGTGDVTSALLQAQLTGTASEGLYTLMTPPQHGTLMLSGMTLDLGDTFTQEDIDNGDITYEHNGNMETADQFVFDFVDQNNGAWLQNQVFQIEILQNTLSVGAEVVQELNCFGDETGQIQVSLTGGYMPFTYSLNGGVPQATGFFDNLPAGDYTVVVTDNFGFTAETAVVTIVEPAELTVSASANGPMITATGMGGTGQLEYSINGTDFQVDNVFDNNPNGVYTVTVRDANGCTSTTEVVVAVDAIIGSTEVTNNVSCNGLSDGSITVNAAGGAPPLEYSLDGNNFQSSNVFDNLPAGSYTVVIRDQTGMTATANTVDITEPDPLTGSANINLNEATIEGMGGTPPYEYSLDGGMFQTDNVFGSLANGDYSVEIRDANGCTETVDFSISVPPLALVNTEIEILCAGATGTLTVSAEGGIPPYEYALDGGMFQAANTFDNVAAGMHTVVVRDSEGTEVMQTITITEPTPVSGTVDITGNNLTGVNPTGGTAPYMVDYDPSLPGDLMDIPNGDYSVTVTDANGCTAVIPFTINYTPVSGAATATNPLCPGEATGSISADGIDGTPPYEFSIDGVNFQSSNVFDNLAAGTYTITVRDALGDLSTVDVTLTDPTAISGTADVSSDTITVNASGGTPPLTYSLDGVNFQSADQFPDVPNGTYTVTVQDANGCTYTIENVIVDFVGTQNLATEWGLVVMPNPSTGLFLVQMSQAPGTDLQADIYDAAGRQVYSQSWSGALVSREIDLSNFPQGVYTLQIRNEKGIATVRLSVLR